MVLLLAPVLLWGGCSGDGGRPSMDGVQHLAGMLRAADGSIAPTTRRTFVGVGHEAVEVTAGSELAAPVIVAGAGTVRFAIASTGSGDPCTAEVLLRRGTRETSLWRSDLARHDRWEPVTVELPTVAGRSVEIVLRTRGDSRTTILWGSPVVAGSPGERSNLLLHEIDTLRADLLEPFGFPGRSSPVIGALARRGALFSECYSTASWTRPAATSILTSLSPPAHGVVWENGRLPDDIVTLADLLRDRGWYTVAFQTNPHAGRPAGLDRGFDVVFEMRALLGHVTHNRDAWTGGTTPLSTGSASGTSELVAFLLRDTISEWSDLPLFLYLHPMDPHMPYVPRPPFSLLPGFEREGASDEINEPLAMYGRDVRTADRFLGEILRVLEEEGLLERTVIALVSDHGEEFGEHGHRDHGKTLYGESIHVPMILRARGALPEGCVKRERVSVLDLMPTVLELLDVPAPPLIEGRSLLSTLRRPGAGNPFPETPQFLHVPFKFVRLREAELRDDPDVVGHLAVMQGPWKLQIQRYGGVRKDRTELFDLRADPRETTNLAAEHPDLARSMESAARTWWSGRWQGARGAGETPLDPDLEQQLRALGYLK